MVNSYRLRQQSSGGPGALRRGIRTPPRPAAKGASLEFLAARGSPQGVRAGPAIHHAPPRLETIREHRATNVPNESHGTTPDAAVLSVALPACKSLGGISPKQGHAGARAACLRLRSSAQVLQPTSFLQSATRSDVTRVIGATSHATAGSCPHGASHDEAALLPAACPRDREVRGSPGSVQAHRTAPGQGRKDRRSTALPAAGVSVARPGRPPVACVAAGPVLRRACPEVNATWATRPFAYQVTSARRSCVGQQLRELLLHASYSLPLDFRAQ